MQTSITYEYREACEEDVSPVAALLRSVRQTCLPYLPDLHTLEENLGYVRDSVFKEDHVVVAMQSHKLVGFCGFRPGWLDHLYVLPAHQGNGVGTSLLKQAKHSSSELRLWTFQQNEQARRFYEANGFTLVTLTDGSNNEEKEPDALYRWAR